LTKKTQQLPSLFFFFYLCTHIYIIIPPIPMLAPWLLAPFCPFRFPWIPYRRPQTSTPIHLLW
jgi:hypothetical protein